MKTIKQVIARRQRTPLGLEVRYERSFLLDLLAIEPIARRHIQHFVFEEFHQFSQLQDLPAFRQIESSGIFFRFTLDRYFIGIEVTGQIVKFLRILSIAQD